MLLSGACVGIIGLRDSRLLNADIGRSSLKFTFPVNASPRRVIPAVALMLYNTIFVGDNDILWYDIIVPDIRYFMIVICIIYILFFFNLYLFLTFQTFLLRAKCGLKNTHYYFYL